MFFPSLPTSYFLRQLSLPHLPVTVSLTLIFHVQPVAKSQTPGPEPSPPLQRLQPWPWWSRLPRTGPPTLPGPANPHHTRPKPLLSPIILPQDRSLLVPAAWPVTSHPLIHKFCRKHTAPSTGPWSGPHLSTMPMPSSACLTPGCWLAPLSSRAWGLPSACQLPHLCFLHLSLQTVSPSRQGLSYSPLCPWELEQCWT